MTAGKTVGDGIGETEEGFGARPPENQLQDLVEHFGAERRGRQHRRRPPAPRGGKTPDRQQTRPGDEPSRGQVSSALHRVRKARESPGVNAIADRGVKPRCLAAQHFIGKPSEDHERRGGGNECESDGSAL